MRAITTALVLVGGLVGCAGGAGSTLCTEIGCRSEVTVDVDLSGRTGPVEVAVAVGGVSVTCDVAVPDADTDAAWSCDDASVTATATADGVAIRVPGGFDDTASVHVVVSGSGAAVDETIAPPWDVQQPNGEGCSPVCVSATVTVDAGV